MDEDENNFLSAISISFVDIVIMNVWSVHCSL